MSINFIINAAEYNDYLCPFRKTLYLIHYFASIYFIIKNVFFYSYFIYFLPSIRKFNCIHIKKFIIRIQTVYNNSVSYTV